MKTSQKIKQNVVNNLAKTTLYENVTELLRINKSMKQGSKKYVQNLKFLMLNLK